MKNIRPSIGSPKIVNIYGCGMGDCMVRGSPFLTPMYSQFPLYVPCLVSTGLPSPLNSLLADFFGERIIQGEVIRSSAPSANLGLHL